MVGVALLGGCTPGTAHHSGESVVLAGTRPTNLLSPTVRDVTAVRSTYEPGGTAYEEGKDFVVDREAGTIRRTPGSRIPDYSKNILYGKTDFDHSKFPGYGNVPFTVYVDYDAPPGDAQMSMPRQQSSDGLPRTLRLLRAKEPVKVIAFGDSITAGGEASRESLRYPNRYAAYLRQAFGDDRVTLENGATGGDTTRNGLARLEEKVLTRHPDLVLVAFGMNDHNIGSVPVDEFAANLRSIVTQIRQKTGAEVILLSTFPPNPLWHYSSHRMGDYAAATERVAAEMRVPYADVYDVWMDVLKRKDAPSLLGNNINHPNDYGHGLYLQALKQVRFERVP
jgi:lysophospholipase L1-like esterase